MVVSIRELGTFCVKQVAATSMTEWNSCIHASDTIILIHINATRALKADRRNRVEEWGCIYKWQSGGKGKREGDGINSNQIKDRQTEESNISEDVPKLRWWLCNRAALKAKFSKTPNTQAHSAAQLRPVMHQWCKNWQEYNTQRVCMFTASTHTFDNKRVQRNWGAASQQAVSAAALTSQDTHTHTHTKVHLQNNSLFCELLSLDFCIFLNIWVNFTLHGCIQTVSGYVVHPRGNAYYVGAMTHC